MSDFDFTNLQDSFPQEEQSFWLDDYGVQQDFMFDDNMVLQGQTPVEQPPELYDYGAQEDSMFGDAMLLDDQPLADQPPEPFHDYGLQQDFMSDISMPIDDQSFAEQLPELYETNAQKEAAFERAWADFVNDPQLLWTHHGESPLDDGPIDFGFPVDGPDLNSNMGNISHTADSTAQTPPTEPVNSFGLVGVPVFLNYIPKSDLPQQVLSQPDSGPSRYPLPPVSHSDQYNFDWNEITQRQLHVLAGNGSGQSFNNNNNNNNNNNTGTRLEAIPENEAWSLEVSTPLPQQPYGDDDDDLDTAARALTTPSPSPAVQAASVKKEPAKKRQAQPTGRNVPAVKFPIHNERLLITGLAEARETATKRLSLDIVDDDRDAVSYRPNFWILRIAKAFDSDFLAQPDDGSNLTPEGQAEWTRWQTEHENKVWSIFHAHADPPKLAQSCACIFYNLVLEAHEPGKGLQSVAKTVTNGGANITLRCSERLNAAIAALERFTIVRYDFLKQDRLDGLAACPAGFVARKCDNMWVNYKKKPNIGPVKFEPPKTEPATDDADAAKGSINKRKRKAPSLSEQPDADSPSTGDVGATQPKPKRVKAVPKKPLSQSTVSTGEVGTLTPVKEEGEEL